MRSRALSFAFGALVLLAVACAKKLSELEPYPCANDGSCPDGRACTPEKVCAPAKIDSVCRAGETDCTTAAPGGRCALGVCGQPCDGTRLTCPEGRVCTVAMGAGGEGACLRPCTDGSECPAHLTCRQLDVRDGQVIRACISPTEKSALGATCKADQDCKAQGSSLVCFAGICTLPCKTQSDCGSGLLCPPGGGGCLLDCTTDEAACDADQSCSPIWKAGLRGCTGKGSAVPACDSVKPLLACGGMCGQSVNSTVQCSSGTCPAGSTCGASGSCDCASAKRCGPNGGACTTSTCSSGEWWCEPSMANVGCGDRTANIMRGCICKDGRRLVSPCGSNVSCETRCQDECDVVAQDCKDPNKPKCASAGDKFAEHDQCVPLPAAPKQENEPCSRASFIDDCDKGLYCSRVRAEPGKAPETRCRRYCASGSACPAGQVCILSRAAIDEGSDLGVCRDRCTFPDGTECGPGARCASLGGCVGFDGTKELDDFCTVETDCASPLVCDFVRNRCVPTCAPPVRDCPSGYTCPASADAGAPDAGTSDGGVTATTVSLCVKEGAR